MNDQKSRHDAAKGPRRSAKKSSLIKTARVVGMRALRQDSLAALDEIDRGGMLIVTTRGRSVAAMVPIAFVEDEIKQHPELAVAIALSLNRAAE